MRLNSQSELGLALADLCEFACQVRGEAPPWDPVESISRVLRCAAYAPLVHTLRRAALTEVLTLDTLRVLAEGQPPGGGIKNSKASNRIWEVRIALAATTFGLGVRVQGESENPDVTFLFPPSRKTGASVDLWSVSRWGVECLALHAQRPDALLSRIAAKASQLGEIPSGQGLIAVDASAVLARGAYLSTFADPHGNTRVRDVQVALRHEIGRIVQLIDQAAFWRRVKRHGVVAVIVHGDVVCAAGGRACRSGYAQALLGVTDATAVDVARRLIAGLAA